MEKFEYFAIAPLWLRLAVLYAALGLTLSLWEAKRAAGSGVLTALGGVLLAAFLAPLTFVRLLWSSKT